MEKGRTRRHQKVAVLQHVQPARVVQQPADLGAGHLPRQPVVLVEHDYPIAISASDGSRAVGESAGREAGALLLSRELRGCLRQLWGVRAEDVYNPPVWVVLLHEGLPVRHEVVAAG